MTADPTGIQTPPTPTAPPSPAAQIAETLLTPAHIQAAIDNASRLVGLVEGMAKPGNQTTEYKLTVFAGVSATLVGGAAQILGAVQSAYPNSHEISAAVAIVSLLVTLLSIVGYGSSRRGLKDNLLDLVKEISDIHRFTAQAPKADVAAPAKPGVAASAAAASPTITSIPNP